MSAWPSSQARCKGWTKSPLPFTKRIVNGRGECASMRMSCRKVPNLETGSEPIESRTSPGITQALAGSPKQRQTTNGSLGSGSVLQLWWQSLNPPGPAGVNNVTSYSVPADTKPGPPQNSCGSCSSWIPMVKRKSAASWCTGEPAFRSSSHSLVFPLSREIQSGFLPQSLIVASASLSSLSVLLNVVTRKLQTIFHKSTLCM
mmetsp:Transcript_172662/g.553360  ORF Transcript_172662/g.553360 Transcript_172662/m.553360 type:complete len:202 (+) Transcript_172662:1166-1771(+)